ncbi:MAG: PH domain-containing protein [Propionibacteriaceae bacterium]|jgi:uncharacterized membrane protein YdbT with pleckstrin-like domain|nr:PH domain-containing protein [Propionibacteriaceae bacterium]
MPVDNLGSGERVIWTGHTHVKALFGPALVFLAVAVAVGAGLAWIPARFEPAAEWVIGLVAAILFVIGCLIPFLRWFTTTYTVTNRRIMTQRGILNKIGHDLPLVRINNVETDRSLLDRLLGCGTIKLTTAADAPVTLPDVPQVQSVHVMISDLLFTSVERDADEALEDH